MTEPVIVKQLVAGSFQVFTYIVACPQTLKGVVINPAGDEDKLLAFIQSEEIQVIQSLRDSRQRLPSADSKKGNSYTWEHLMN